MASTVTPANIQVGVDKFDLALEVRGELTNAATDITALQAGGAFTAPVAFPTTIGLTATGSTQGTALVLTTQANIIATTAASTGVVLPTKVGTVFYVINRGASTLAVYPPSGAQIDAVAVNTAVTLATTVMGRYLCVSATQFYTV